MPDGDISRSTFRPSARYSGVRMQQGRVQLDADWNEQVDIAAHRHRAAVTDIVGPAGVPVRGGGFHLSVAPDGLDLLVSQGRMWVDGVLCDAATDVVRITPGAGGTVDPETTVLDGVELAADQWVRLLDDEGHEEVTQIGSVDGGHVVFTSPPGHAHPWTRLRRVWSLRSQPDLPSRPGVPPVAPGTEFEAAGDSLVYLDVWERPVTALEDPAIREVALGGPDTATRTKTVWQLWVLGLGAIGEADDFDVHGVLNEQKPTGRMAARAHSDPATADLCAPVARGGYTGAENQLYRVQIRSADGDDLRFVWSRDNASVTTAWEASSAGGVLTVAGTGRDPVLGFGPGQWVELADDGYELSSEPGPLAKITDVKGNLLTVDSSGPTDISSFTGGHAKLRRWDSPGEVAARVGEWIPIEHGVEVRFDQGTYCKGDYWLVPARTTTAAVEWPQSSSGAPLPRHPAGVAHAYAPLALVRSNGAMVQVVKDYRAHFPALIDMTAARIPHGGTELPGAATVEEAIDLLARRIIELEQHITTLHPERPPPRRGQRWGRRDKS